MRMGGKMMGLGARMFVKGGRTRFASMLRRK